ncbi:DUF6707 family protein [Paenibacillus shenyangensis]|uniref:DUF6707 family protein n=1 Tax=Paenibacillus sp. A9 TaxID=1284352 RepID=UPI00036B1864|nr:DUF6707 family protein [Paenibacillus sp. A9]
MKLKDALAIIRDNAEAADYLAKIPARSRRTAKGELEAYVRLGWLLYALDKTDIARPIVEPLTSVPFENNYDYWTWIEYALILQAELSTGQEQGKAIREQAVAAVEQAVQTGETAVVQVKQKVQSRFLKGETLHTDYIEKAVQHQDEVAEANARLLHLIDLSKLSMLGGSAEYPAEQAAREAAAQQSRIREITDRHGWIELDPFK